MSRQNPFVVGLTGSIGMGKSTTAQMFRDVGVPVWDADTAVHEMYATGGIAVAAVSKLHPAAVINGAVDRDALKAWIKLDPSALKKLESVVHPLLAEQRSAFVKTSDADIVVLDIPLLFEMGNEGAVDLVVVVSVDENTQKQRVTSRDGMTEDLFQTLLAKQLPDSEKRRRADVVIITDSRESANNAVTMLLGDIRAKLSNA
jgi:dephospho-CoA kinase